jgi:hypothetical protein
MKKFLLVFTLIYLYSFHSYADFDQFIRDVKSLSKFPNRLSGTKEYKMAADYIKIRLKQIGVDKIVEHKFPSVQAFTKKCELKFKSSSKRLKLFYMRPNGIILPTTPPEGIT